MQLRWNSSGFQRLELDGKKVQANGSLTLVPKTSHRYTLEGIRPDGSREIRELDLTVAASRSDVQPPAPIVRELPPGDLQEINTALRQWTQAMLSNDPNREAACYAPELDRYFLRSGVTQDFVRQYLTAFHNGGSTFTAFNISDIQARPEPDGSAEVRFNKEVELATPSGPKHQALHSTLHLKRINGAWKITSERDFLGPLRQLQ